MQPILTSVGMLVLGALISFLAAAYWFKRNAAIKETERIAMEHRQLTERVIALEQSLALVGQTILPMSTAFQAILVKELTHLHTPVTDALLAKLGPPFLLTPAEEHELAAALAERVQVVDDQISESERDAALMLPYVMKRVRAEAASALTEKRILRIVTIAAEEPAQ